MYSYETRLSLHLRHPTADLKRFFTQLDLQANVIELSGDFNHRAKEKLEIFKSSYCIVKFKKKKGSINLELAEIVKKISVHKNLLLDFIENEGDINFLIGVFLGKNGGETIDWELMGHLRDLKIRLEFAIYGKENSVCANERLVK